MPTITSMADKVFGAGNSTKAHATIDLQRQREAKVAQGNMEVFEPKDTECDWRVALWMQSARTNDKEGARDET
jgi:hypothetical protein